MNKSTSNPQPYAVANKENKEKKPTNLEGSEMDKSAQKKEQLVKERNKNARDK